MVPIPIHEKQFNVLLVKLEGRVTVIYHLSLFTWVTKPLCLVPTTLHGKEKDLCPSMVDLAELSGGSGEKILYRWKLQWKSMEYEWEK